MKLKIVGLLVVGLLAGPVAASADSIVANGGFETGDLTRWSCVGADRCYPDAEFVHSGAYAWRGFDNEGFATLWQEVTTTPGAAYDFSFYSMATDNSPGNILRYQIGTGPIVPVSRTTDFALTSTSFLAAGPTTTLNFYFETDPGTGTWVIDDVAAIGTVGRVPEPASLLLLGTGLAGLVAARKRRQ